MTDLDPEARRILQLARSARTPGSADKRRVALALGLSVMTASGAGLAHASAAKSGGVFTSIKLWLGSGMLLLAAAGGYVALSPSPASGPPTAAMPHSSAMAAKQPVPEPLSAPQTTAKATAEPAPAMRTRHADTLPQELDLLHRAQVAWRGREAKHALTLLDEHAQLYPRSELRFERSALRVLSLCELGRETEARRLARTLRKQAENSPVRAALEESCAKQQRMR